MNRGPIYPLASPIDERRVSSAGNGRQERALGRSDRLAAPVSLAGRATGQPGVHHVPDGQAFPAGPHPEGRLAVFERTFNRAMGLWADGQTLWLSTLYQLWRFENLLRPGELYQGHDRLYVPEGGQHHRRPRYPRRRHRRRRPPGVRRHRASAASRRWRSGPASLRSGGRRS